MTFSQRRHNLLFGIKIINTGSFSYLELKTFITDLMQKKGFTADVMYRKIFKDETYWNSVYSRILSDSTKILIPTKRIDQNVLE